MSEQPVPPQRLRWGRGVILGSCAALCWFAWLAWDRTYQLDPVTGVASGPYETRQVLGAVVTLAVLASVGALWAGPRETILSLTIGFTAAWSASAAADDDTGLWVVGALLVLAGMALGVGLVTSIVTLLSRRWRSSPT